MGFGTSRKPPAAPTLVRPNLPDKGAAPAAQPAAPRKKKVASKKSALKKKVKAAMEKSEQAAEAAGAALQVGSEEWIEEQRRLTSLMTRMYDKPWDSARDNEEDDDEEDDDEDVLAYYDYEAEEKALAARVAELKRVSSTPIRGVPGSARPATYTVANALATSARAAEAEAEGDSDAEPVSDGEPAATEPAEAAAAVEPIMPFVPTASSSSDPAAAKAAPTPEGLAAELEPFCIGRRPNSFEEIEISLEGAPEGTGKLATPVPEEPPLTPRSLASSIAARRQANQQMRAVRNAPTGA